MRPEDHADLGLGYPPEDDTEDLRPNTATPSTSTAKHQVEGIKSTIQNRK